MEYRKVYIASNHTDYELKEHIITCFSNQSDFKNLGYLFAENVDYFDYTYNLACKVNKNPEQLSIRRWQTFKKSRKNYSR